MAALNDKAKAWKQPKSLSTDAWIRWVCVYVYTHKPHTPKRNNAIFSNMWTALVGDRLSKHDREHNVRILFRYV